jgi:heat shock protein HtpX
MAPTLYQQRARNTWRTAFLMSGFLALAALIGYAVSLYFGNPSILIIVLFFAVFMNVYSYWFSDRQVLRMTKARPATREEHFDLYTITENLSIAAGLPMPKLYVIDDPSPNAFATGRNEKHAVVAATTGLVAMLDRKELEGVIAHELAHIQNKDMLVMTVAVVLVGFLAMVSDFFAHMAFWGGNQGGDSNKGGVLMVVGVIAIILAPIAAQLIQLAISRKREFLADASGALLTRYPEGLASALQKISAAGRPMRSASHATAHLFIGNPFGAGKTKNWMDKLFATHPPVEERVMALTGQALTR